MDPDEFERIRSLAAYPSDASLSVSAETFSVIKRQMLHRQELKTHRQDKTLKKYFSRYENESICQIAKSVGFSRVYWRGCFWPKKYGWETNTTIKRIFKDAMKDEWADESGRGGLSIEEYAQVVQEVRECIAEDPICSPLADRIRRNVGEEYEYLLLESLRNRTLVFESEDMLREKGMAKTPDARLLLPIGVKESKAGQVRVVNWIDSKAMFGDRDTHENENLEQLQGYVNRYGPGMVIYWFGHVAQLSSDSDIVVTDSFPQAISLPGAYNPLATVLKAEEDAVLPLQLPKTLNAAFNEDWSLIVTCEL